MEDTLLKTILFADGLQLCLYESRNGDGGSYISIKHSVKVREMQGQVIIAPMVVPDLVKALTEAAMELERRAMYFAGKEDGRS